jgi:argininosuccinate lyase
VPDVTNTDFDQRPADLGSSTSLEIRLGQQPLSGRVSRSPDRLIVDEVLEPQFRFEVDHLLRWYVLIEQVLALEYQRMGLVSLADASAIAGLLDSALQTQPVADPATNLADIAFALERRVEEGLKRPVGAWHVDRSRNDLQATAQVMFYRERLLGLAGGMANIGESVLGLADATKHLPMPGYTHLQPAQVISPGFYLAALAEQILHSLRRLLTTYDGIDACPLGAGAMAGQELAWDREWMARLLGFGRAMPHALTSVASRRAALEVTAELSLFGAALSRFVTDLLTWSGGEHGFVDLPDDLSGISSAMPQKKNFPVLERIRGLTGHLGAFHVDALLGQRNTPFGNSVEVSKEAGAYVATAFETTAKLLRLLGAVIEGISFRPERMRASCDREFLGGSTLATGLTLEHSIPWRTAQLIAGRYITSVLASGAGPQEPSPDTLRALAEELGHTVSDPDGLLSRAFDTDASLSRRRSAGSTSPSAVAELVGALTGEYAACRQEWDARAARIDQARAEVRRLLGLPDTPPTAEDRP